MRGGTNRLCSIIIMDPILRKKRENMFELEKEGFWTKALSG